MKRITLFCFIFICACNLNFAVTPTDSSARPKVLDVDSLGTLWIFTYDRSYSMSSRNVDLSSVVDRMERMGILSEIDYSHDRYFIYYSGVREGGYYLRRLPSLDSSFIHSCAWHGQNLDNIEFKSVGLNGFRHELTELLKSATFPFYQSFVSQIRLYSLVKALNYLKNRDQESVFKNVRIVTITDDAPQSDQWQMDYHNLSEWDPSKVAETDYYFNRFVYCKMTGEGLGYLSDVNRSIVRLPHIWVYSYHTMQQQVQSLYYDGQAIISVRAFDGQHINLSVDSMRVNGDSICFCYIDSLCVNDRTIQVNKYLVDTLTISAKYSNRLGLNQTMVFGKVQVHYIDSIYGSHYKKYPLLQQVKVMSYPCWMMIWIIGSLLGILLMVFLVYILWILPNIHLFTLYAPERSVFVRRGYTWQWKNDMEPLMFAELNCGQVSSLVGKHQNFCVKSKSLWKDGVIIDSPVSLSFADNFDSVNTLEDIEEFYSLRSGDYNEHLRELYQQTIVYHLYLYRRKSYNALWRKVFDMLIGICNMVDAHYYYWRPITAPMSVAFSVSSFPMVWFKMEVEKCERKHRPSYEDDVLAEYYSDITAKAADWLIVIDTLFTKWSVFRLNSDKLHVSLANVELVMQYDAFCEEKLDIDAITSKLEHQIRNSFSCDRIAKMVYQFTSSSVSFHLCINSSLQYISMVEQTQQHASQQLFDPFADKMCTEKNILLKPMDGTLIYASALPFDMVKDIPELYFCLDENHRLDINQPEQCILKIMKQDLSIKNLSIKFR